MLTVTKNVGFSLLELMIVLGIISIIFVFSLPSNKSIAQKNEVERISLEIEQVIQYAKVMAVATDEVLILKPLHEYNWAKGLILFRDSKDHQYLSTDQLVHQWQWNYNYIQLIWHGFLSSSYLLFSPDLKHSAMNGNFQVVVDSKQKLTLYLNRLGRLRKEII